MCIVITESESQNLAGTVKRLLAQLKVTAIETFTEDLNNKTSDAYMALVAEVIAAVSRSSL